MCRGAFGSQNQYRPLAVHVRSLGARRPPIAGGGMRGNVWTDDGVTLLRKLWAEGATAAAIGRRLGGFSRSAVLGKVFRLRLNCAADTAARIERPPSERNSPARRRRRQPRKSTVAPPGKLPGRFT